MARSCPCVAQERDGRVLGESIYPFFLLIYPYSPRPHLIAFQSFLPFPHSPSPSTFKSNRHQSTSHHLTQGYSEFRLPSHPHLTPLIRAYTQGPAPNSIWNDVSIGPYWEQPGRRILDDHLRQVPRPTEVLPDLFEDWRESYFTGTCVL